MDPHMALEVLLPRETLAACAAKVVSLRQDALMFFKMFVKVLLPGVGALTPLVGAVQHLNRSLLPPPWSLYDWPCQVIWWSNCGSRKLSVWPVNIFLMSLKMFFSVEVLSTKRTPE